MISQTDFGWVQPIVNLITFLFSTFHWAIALVIIFILSVFTLVFVFMWFFVFYFMNKKGFRQTTKIVDKIKDDNQYLINNLSILETKLNTSVNIINQFLLIFSENDIFKLSKLYLGSNLERNFVSQLKEIVFSYFERELTHRKNKEELYKNIIEAFNRTYLENINKWIYGDFIFSESLKEYSDNFSIYSLIKSFVYSLEAFEKIEATMKLKEDVPIFNSLRRDIENSIYNLIKELDETLDEILKVKIISFIKDNPESKFYLMKGNL